MNLTRLSSLGLAAVATISAAALAIPPAGSAARPLHHDAQGRAIHFETQVPRANAAGYARILSEAIHGGEISTVTVVITDAARVTERCGEGSEACYLWTRSGTQLISAEIVIPAWPTHRARQVLLHEYAHHIDASSLDQPGAVTFDGTPRWFAARNMERHLGSGRVDWMYGGGWARSIGEIFAEDYVVLNSGPTGRHRIDWLGRPKRAALAAMAADLGQVVPTRTTDSAVPPPPGDLRLRLR